VSILKWSGEVFLFKYLFLFILFHEKSEEFEAMLAHELIFT